MEKLLAEPCGGALLAVLFCSTIFDDPRAYLIAGIAGAVLAPIACAIARRRGLAKE